MLICLCPHYRHKSLVGLTLARPVWGFLLDKTMDYIRFCNWETFQHYKKRNPPWVKLYSYFLDDDDFDCMPDASKLLFFCLLSFASRRENKVRLDFKWLQKKLPIKQTITKKTLQPLIDTGFIERYHDASNGLAEGKQDAIPEERRGEAEERQRREEFPDNLNTEDFLKAWTEWENHRKEIKKKLTPTTRKKQLKLLSEHPNEAIEMMEQSMRNGWQGLFLPKGNGGKNVRTEEVIENRPPFIR